MTIKALQGFRDFSPAELALREHIFSAWRDVARRYGFEEYDGPPLEPLELYTRKSGDEIVGQLYHFRDKGDREVALRPEMTPTLARMMAARSSSLPKPIKWFSLPQLFRYERKQRGRLREHFQLNLDILGAREVEADVELLEAALDIQRALGLTEKDVEARVNDRRLVHAALELIGVDESRMAAAYGAIDKFHKVPREAFAQLLESAGISREGIESLIALCEGEVPLERWFGNRLQTEGMEEAAAALDAIGRYQRLIEDDGFGDMVRVDFSIVRGLAYYTGIVFELYDRRGELRAVCGGGRYDDLVASLGGPDLPALGFGMGDVVLAELLKERDLLPKPRPRITVMVIPVGAELKAAARAAMVGLRAKGISAETPFSPQGVGKDLKAADQAGALFAAIVGPEELQAGQVKLKRLATGEEERVPREALADIILSARS